MRTNHKNDPLFELTGLDPADLADTLAKNPRAYMALKGAVAERHLRHILEDLISKRKIESFRCGEGDFQKDFYVTVKGKKKPVIIECKNVQVIPTSNKAMLTEYLNFLKHVKLLPDRHALSTFTEMTPAQLKAVLADLPLELRESSKAKYMFSRAKSGVTGRVKPGSEKAYLEKFSACPISIDFQRTRNSRDNGDEDNKARRYYEVGELDIVAACLFSRTLEWDFVFCTAKNLERHNSYPKRYSNRVILQPGKWVTDLCTLF